MSAFSQTTPSTKNVTITDEEFLQLRDLIYEESGIYIAENRKYLIESRLRNRIRLLKLKSFGEYYYFLQYDTGKRAEMRKLFDVVTTNETSFFRNMPQLEVFQEQVIKNLIETQRKKKQKKIRIWSAGCSTGEEPYTIAMQLHEVLQSEISAWDIKITANDLSEEVLSSARRGVYSKYALRTTPNPMIQKYFEEKDEKYTVKPLLKKILTFGQINLSDRRQLRHIEKSHIVFCRNVIIYFDTAMKKQVIASFYDNLLAGGVLLIGHSESLHNISRAFRPEYHKGAIIYRKGA